MVIKFMTNSVYSFWGLHCACMRNQDRSQKVLSGFEDERLYHLADLTFEKEKRTQSNLILQDIVKENITDYEGIRSVMSSYFSSEELENIDQKLRPAFEAYSSFLEKNAFHIDKNIEALNKNQSLYEVELQNLYKCFNIPSDKQCICFLNPFPKDKMMDGISNPTCVSMDYSLTRNEDESHYVQNSDILKRKESTPFHEATHFLFFNSQLKKDIEQEKTPAATKLLDEAIKDFEKNGNPIDREKIKVFAVGAINEAFAACSTALYNEKTTGKPVSDNNEWYHGWKQANDLTRQMYPLFKEYVTAGKTFDEDFIGRLTNNIKIDRLKRKNIPNYTTENNTSKTMAELRGTSSAVKVPQTRKISLNKEDILKLYQSSKQKVS